MNTIKITIELDKGRRIKDSWQVGYETLEDMLVDGWAIVERRNGRGAEPTRITLVKKRPYSITKEIKLDDYWS